MSKISLVSSLREILLEGLISVIKENATPQTRDQIVDMLANAGGNIFTVVFTKKDGTERVMNARLGVKKHLRGGSLPYNPVEKGLLPVFDLQKGEYRVINKNTITAAKIGGRSYVVADV